MPGSAAGDDGDEQVVGKVGRVCTRIPGGERPGEIVVRIRGGTETYLAYADAEIPRSESALVLVDLGNRAVSVAPYP